LSGPKILGMNEMTAAKFLVLVPIVIAGAAIVLSLVTGKTINPLTGTNPFIVSRGLQPARYWVTILELVIFSIFMGYVSFQIFFVIR
jgi:hypothetical protein